MKNTNWDVHYNNVKLIKKQKKNTLLNRIIKKLIR